MTTPEQPEWLRNHLAEQGQQYTAATERKGRWQPGESGNPRGRPVGVKNKRTLMAEQLEKDGVGISQVITAAALEGDMQACALVLSRTVPPLRPRAERVQFTLNTDATFTDQAKQIMAAIAAGEVDLDTGKSLMDCLGNIQGLFQVDELIARVSQLEQSVNGVTRR
jgi:hypothetical protein